MLEWSGKIVALLLCVWWGSLAVFAAEKESLWEYADPTADVMIYINTRQPEKAMEKGLWQRISRDRTQALKEDAEERLFDVSGRDMELIANLHIVSLTPFAGSIRGVADITGNLQEDIGKLMATLKQNNAAPPQMREQNDMSFYNFTLPAMGALPASDIQFVPVKPNRIQFWINIAGKSNPAQQLQVPAKGVAVPAAQFRGGELAFACAAKPEKLSASSLASTKNGQQLNEFLQQLNQICISGYVRGRLLMVDAVFAFKEHSLAAGFAGTVRPLLNHVSSASGALLLAPRAIQSGREVDIVLPINISKAWNFISLFNNSGLRAKLSGPAVEEE